MIELDLKWAGFILFLLLTGVAWLATYLERKKAKENPFSAYGIESETAQSALDLAPVGILLIRKNEEIVFANQQAKTIFREDIHSSSAFWRTALQTELEQADELGATTSYRTYTRPRRQSIRWWYTPLGQLHLIIVSDQSQIKNRTVQQEQLWGALSHEMRTPLTSILSHLELLHANSLSEQMRENSLAIMHQQTKRLSRLVQGVLEYGRLQSADLPERMPTDLILIAEDAVGAMILMAENKKISLDLSHDMGLPLVLGNRDRLRQVFANLIDNGIKYCPAESEITVLLQTHPDGVKCSVSDNGMGIADAHLPHLTEQFYRVNKEVQGSGLGLALIKEILRQHDSELQIESRTTSRTGTTFSFVLPAVRRNK